ncbi:hypothetical protein QSV08_09745 [Maribacter sp. BPC-D8]|uniref:NADase-type glycan-binding domain-containing protein n=1 Tax=Maribacter sp. BPC-D8 TaxID=3053613 RepID=UPI002B490474|nr:hypothetical protein [Maribacter sp. BPC-D8]WRI31518.1 hypothetical protein QSV08_09745 [Maribacter sp. BPC-D8]
MNSIKTVLFTVLSITHFSVFAQEPPSLEPNIGAEYNFVEKKELWSTCEKLFTDMTVWNNYDEDERNKLTSKCGALGYSEACEDMWSIVCGDDWTDEGYNIQKLDKQIPFCSVSSALSPQKNNNYNHTSISDLSYATAWVEGVKGDGIGEYVEFNFPAQHPRITAIKIANGYIKDKTTWKNNSRVKQLKVCVNNEEFAILNLKDVYAEQLFKIPTIGYEITYRGYNDDGTSWYRYKDANGNSLKSYNKEIESGDTIRFEIMSVYKGDKYDDTAITEIYFDGLDVY